MTNKQDRIETKKAMVVRVNSEAKKFGRHTIPDSLQSLITKHRERRKKK